MTTDRARHNVLVVDAHALGMIGVIRSLGQAGYRVHGASADPRALGLASRYCAYPALHPAYGSGLFGEWLADYIRRESIDVIIPSEGFYHACGVRCEEFAPLIPDAVEHSVWQRCMSKVETHEQLSRSADGCTHLPATAVAHRDSVLVLAPEVLSAGPPFYVKGDAALALHPDTGAAVMRCETAQELETAVQRLLGRYRAVLYQSHSPGHKVGVSLWRHGDRFRAENMTLGLHMNPCYGGMMSLRKTFWHPALLADARRKMELLGWRGVAMMEYKWDRGDDDFRFIEINARYWGYLHLDLYSGIDFPRLQVDAHLRIAGERPEVSPGRVTCRHAIPGEYGYLASLLRTPDIPRTRKARECLAFGVAFLNPLTRSDLLYPGDRRLYWRQLYRFCREQMKSLYTRLRPRYRSHRV